MYTKISLFTSADQRSQLQDYNKALPRFVRNPFLIYVLIKTRQDSHHLASASAHYDVTADSIQDINGFSLPAAHQRECLHINAGESFFPSECL